MNKLTTEQRNTSVWVTVEEASKRCERYSKKEIRQLYTPPNKRIGAKPADDGKHILVNLIDIWEYESAHPEKPILNTVWDGIDYIRGECFYPLFGYDCKYFVSNKLRVINCSNGQVLTPQIHKDNKGKETGYKQVTLMKKKKNKHEKLHRLVAETQVDNVLEKEYVHHIKPSIPANDNPDNLLWVCKWQHDKLHRLLKAGKMEEYKQMVLEIKKENHKLYRIPHLDYKPNKFYNFYMYVTYRGYKIYKETKDVPLDCIKREMAELKK